MGNINITEIIRAEIKAIVKEAVLEAFNETQINLAGNVITEQEKVEVKEELINGAVEVTKEIEPVEAEEDTIPHSTYTKEELDEMKYNDIKSIASSLGIKAVGKKDDLIQQILELSESDEDGEVAESKDEQEDVQGNENTSSREESGDSEETEDDIRAEFKDFLNSLSREELEEIADECGVKYRSNTNTATIVSNCVEDLDKLEEALEVLGYYEEDDEDEEDESLEDVTDEVSEDEEEDEEDITDQLGLNDMEIEELADILAKHELSTKGKKQALIDRIVKAVEDGIIELADEDEEEEEEEEKPVKSTKPLKKKDDARTQAEDEIEETIRADYKSKVLKDSAISKFIKPYLDGSAEKLDKAEALEKYIEIKRAFVDDDGEVYEAEEPYERDGKYHCCGRALKTLDNGNPYCEICGCEYEEE